METTTEQLNLEQQSPSSDAKKQLLARIDDKTITVAIIGLGYVGLPFLLEKAKVGLNVIGYDRNAKRVAQVNQGTSYIEDVDSAQLSKIIAAGKVKATTDYRDLSAADVIVICVPTPLDKNLCPDLSYIESVSQQIAQIIKPGQLVSLESTTYPGTTEEIILPILEQSGLKAGFDFFLAHSPERVDPGNQRYTTHNTNKVVGGIDQDSLDVAQAFYSLAIQHVVTVSSAKAAEMVKVFENTYRAVNIALANEMALLCDAMGLNTWEVLDAAFTKPFGISPFYPGPGVGGHCIPIDPHYLEWKAREYNFQTQFIALAGEVNRRMPTFVLQKITRILNSQALSLNGANVLLLGVAYKSDISDSRESPALVVHQLLVERGACVSYHDSWVRSMNSNDKTYHSIELNEQALAQHDLVVILTDHANFDYQLVADHAVRILDTRNAMKKFNMEKIELL